MKHLTLCFLIKRNEIGEPSQICLAMKKRGFGEGKFNGVGGKVEQSETIEQALHRETLEEIGVKIVEVNKVGEINFSYTNIDRNILVHVYFCETWENEPIETEEMNPQWFDVANIPYQKMWIDDIHWLPLVLAGKLIKAKIVFQDELTIDSKEINIVNNM
jgi:mutator protein MutT